MIVSLRMSQFGKKMFLIIVLFLTAEIADQLEAIMENIFSNLSGPAKAFYEREFDFFGKITAISGEIR